MRIIVLILSVVIAMPFLSAAQTGGADSATQKQSFLESFNKISDRSLNFIDRKYASLTNSIHRRTQKMLYRMQHREDKLRKKMQGKDSTKAKELFANSDTTYKQLQAELQTPTDPTTARPLKEYVSGLDSTATAFKYLQQNAATIPGIDPEKLQQIQNINAQLQQLQGQMQTANEAEQFASDREQQLKAQLGSYGLDSDLLGMNQEVFYYRQQLEQYKELINDKEKLEEAVLTKLTELPAFQDFMAKNSYVAQLFSLPGNYGDPATLAGMQTRDQVAQMVAQRIGGGVAPAADTDPAQFFQPQIAQAQDSLGSLKNMLSRFGGSSGTIVNPDFKPDQEKTKTFLKRLVYGFNFQTQQPTTLLPSIGTLGVSLGFKISGSSIIGVGASYLLGMGNGINHIAFSSQGAGLRSYIDLKIKGNLWFSGGYEANYLQAFQKFTELENVSAWQQSALFGLEKKIKLSKAKESDMQVLFDALYKQHSPTTQPIIFRIGYSFN